MYWRNDAGLCELGATRVIEAAFWGMVASSSLIIGAEVTFGVRLSRMVVGLIMAFGVGALIASVSFELIVPAMESSGTGRVALGLATGSVVFFVGDLLIERLGSESTDTDQSETASEGGRSSLGMVLGTVLDGIPESAVLGMSLVAGGEVSAALLVGIWIANFPGSLAATIGMQASGWSRGRIRAIWLGVMTASAVAAAVGFLVVEHSSTLTGSFVEAFAAGALLTFIADELMPEAYERSSIYAGLATTAGFAVAGLLTSLG
jgi:ZIP family zinc transporter